MFCESCGKNPVTTHVKTIINGELTEYSLCTECAQKLGYVSLLGGFYRKTSSTEAIYCKCCGSTFEDIARSGNVGCSECYHTFYERLIPLIQRIHGNAKHRGKVPGGSTLQTQPQGQLSVMRRELREAIEAEDFEYAVTLRDRIKNLEEKTDE